MKTSIFLHQKILLAMMIIFLFMNPYSIFAGTGKDKNQQSKIERFFESYENHAFIQYGYDILARGEDQAILRVGPDYKVGPDDEIQINVWGEALNTLGNIEKNGSGSNYVEYRLKVDGNGTIIVPAIGGVVVNGRTLNELTEVITAKLKNYCRNCEVSVAIDKPRMIRVLVTGYVENPGYVQVLSGSSVFNVLLAAGGITKQGSMRNITVKKGDGKNESLDLYKFINTGDLNVMPDIRLGDIIHVRPIGPVVLMKGQISRPGIYELKGNESLKELVNFVGGFLPDTETRHVEITRFENGNRVLINQDMGKGELNLVNGDTVHFIKQYAMVRQSVKLKGYVPMRKAYAWHEGFYLKDILDDIETFKPQTAMDYAEIKRYDPKTMEPSIVSFSPESVVHWKEKDSNDANIVMQPFDEVVLFSIEQLKQKPMVAVSGGVNYPARYPWVEDMTVLNLIRLAGGVNWKACDKGIVVRYTYNENREWTTSHLDFDLSEIRSGASRDIRLQPLDRVIVNSRSDYRQTEWDVTVTGEVKYPGSYPIGAQTRLSDVLMYSGALTENADLEGIILLRIDAREIQQSHQNTAETVLRKGLLGVASQIRNFYLTDEARMDNKQSLAIIENYLAHSEARNTEGRIVLNEKDLVSLKTLKGSASDIVMQPDDRIIIPEKSSMVTVVGEVYAPSSYLFTEKNTVSDYLALAGGVGHYADIDGAFILRKNGTVLSYAQKQGKFNNIVMKSGDVLIIPSKILKMAKP